MKLISSKQSSSLELLPQLSEFYIETEAANDTSAGAGPQSYLRDLNELVSHLTTNVVRAAGVENLDLRVQLHPDIHDHVAAPALISFVIGGVLTTQLESFGEVDDAKLFVLTEIEDTATVISVFTNTVPSLQAVRAVEEKLGFARALGADSVLLHCREIVEKLGGCIQLRSDNMYGQSWLGFDLRIPTVPKCNTTGLNAPAPLIRTSTFEDYRMTA